jgi:cellulose synthase (UDP-forming)
MLNGSRSTAVTMLLMTISAFSTLRYGYWRVRQTWEGITSSGHLHRWDNVFVLLLLFAEIYAFLTLILGYFQTLRPLRRRPAPLAEDASRWPSVDVFIPTYNEPLSVVRATVLASLGMDYPAGKTKVFILDDGRRKEFREFAAEAGAGYISRSDNAHAKAGNINHALKQTDGEYVAIFDSDHVPTSSFLQATLGWFLRDRQLGMVQTPHHFYSPDPFERNLRLFRKIPNEGELFHRLVQDGNDLWNASFFCGSCAVLRREALHEIGGIAIETVTEDAHTALRMQRRGWNTAYINIPQAAGLATETLAAHIGQRIRWARGMIQVLRLENPLFAGGLALSQRLCYFNATTHFLFALPRLIFLTIPLVYLLLGMVNIYGYSLAVFAYALPHIVLSNLTSSRIQGRHRFSFWNEIYEAVLAPYILLPTLLAMINPRLGKFNVTAKGGVVRRSYFDRRIALPLLFLLALNVAGLYKAHQRYVNEPQHHDTVIMNAAWAVYNIVILSVAVSVAWERRQRRSQVRVDVRVPFTLTCSNGGQVTGMASQLSLYGASARLDRSMRFPRGAAVSLMLGEKDWTCRIPALVAHSAGRRQHFVFTRLGLDQEYYLVNQVYSRPDAWVSWNDSRARDNPLRSLLHIVWLAIRGMFILSFGLPGLLPTRDRSGQPATKRGEGKAALAASIVLAFLSLTPMRLQASDGPERTATLAAQPAVFNEEYEIGVPGAEETIALRGAGASYNLYFGVPVTKIISKANLKLRYAAPMLRPNEASLELTLNGTLAGRVMLTPGANAEAEIALPTDLLTNDNTLSLQLAGACPDCGKNPWITISATSAFSLSGTKLPLANDLALLPVPFFDPAGHRPWSLPVVFADRPDANVLKAAAVMASWFGIFSDVRGAQFPVSVGELPQGNAVIFVLRASPLAASLSLPQRHGPLLAIRDNPHDAYGKLLILAGESTNDLLIAARALVTRNNYQAHADAVFVSEVAIPARRQYDAPRWLQTDRPAAIGTYTTAQHLELPGSGSITIYFRLPPDLFFPARESVPLLLKYKYAGVAEGSKAALHIRLNDKDIDSIPLTAAASRVEHSEVVRVPTGRLRPYINTLVVDFDFGRQPHQSNVRQYAAIRRDSSLDLRGLHHSVVLPRLELFADAGYPYTAWPDLGRTAVILPPSPSPADYEALLGMAGFFGAQTGYPTTGLTVIEPGQIGSVTEKDLILLGTVESQPLLSEWSGSMPLGLLQEGMRLNQSSPSDRLLNPEWAFRGEDRNRLGRLAASDRPADAIVEAFVSPLRDDRSAIAIVPATSAAHDAIVSLFMPSARQGAVYGSVAASRDGRYQSFLVGIRAYHSGHLDPYQLALVLLLENYWLIPLFVVLLAAFISSWLRRSTERVAARRLAAGRSY